MEIKRQKLTEEMEIWRDRVTETDQHRYREKQSPLRRLELIRYCAGPICHIIDSYIDSGGGMYSFRFEHVHG